MTNIDSIFDLHGKKVILEKNVYANQSYRSVLVRYGNTSVLVSLNVGNAKKNDDSPRFGLGLMVDFLFRAYAHNEIPKSFYRREGKLTEREILASRIIDRTFRPLIDEDVANDISLNCILLSFDPECAPEIAAIIGVSYVIGISELPFKGPVVGLYVNLKNNDCFLDSIKLDDNRLVIDNDQEKLELFVSSTDKSIIMVEAESKFIDEEKMLTAVGVAHEESQPIINWLSDNIIEDRKIYFADNSNNFFKKINVVHFANESLNEKLLDEYSEVFRKLYSDKYINKSFFIDSLSKIHSSIYEEFEKNGYIKSQINLAIKYVEKHVMTSILSETNKRIDGRACDDIRVIDIKLNVLDGLHGSALFTRGETQALVITTMGDMSSAQTIDDYTGRKENLMLHYNFHPFSVGEISPNRAPGRREIGHGCLAFKSIKNIIPSFESSPYTIRIVSDILSSDGSSSMATVCGSTLSLMDAGIKISDPIAGIAMGLVIKDENNFFVLSDISGEEDSLGDMDFKVAGSVDYITSLQMDVKSNLITKDILAVALKNAKKGRTDILQSMNKAIPVPRDIYKNTVKKIKVCKIDKSNVSKVIGAGGKIIKSICENTESTIDIDGDSVYVSSKTCKGLEDAVSVVNILAGINNIVPAIGMKAKAFVTGVQSFGVFAAINTDTQGLIHVSEMFNENNEKVLLKEGDIIDVLIKSIDKQTGKIKLSLFKGNSGNSSTDNYHNHDSKDNFQDFYKKKSSKGFDKKIGNKRKHKNSNVFDEIKGNIKEDHYSDVKKVENKLEDDDDGSIRFF